MDIPSIFQALIFELESEGRRPHLVIQTKTIGTFGFPEEIIESKGHVVLNVSSQATNNSLRIGKYQCQCNVSINGRHHQLTWHPDAIVLVYSPDGGPKLLMPEPVPKQQEEPKPHLRAVK